MDNRSGAIKMREYYSSRGDGYECGQGSIIENTTEIREFLPKIFNKYNINTINDAPCGSFNWMGLVDMDDVVYAGFDIDDILVDMNKKRYPSINFDIFDISKEVLPVSDIILCRDCLFHLQTDIIVDVLYNFKKSKAKYLLSTTYPHIKENIDFVPKLYGNNYGFRKINLCLSPFNLGNCVDFVLEPKWSRIVGLWRIN